MFGKAFKPGKYYVFNYKPRYYNERKEHIAQLQKELEPKNNTTEEVRIKLTKNNLRSNWVKSTKTATNNGTNKRLALIIAILAGAAAYILELHKLF